MKEKLRSTEFWFSLLSIIVGGLVGAGVLGDGTIYARIGGWGVTALGSMGYTYARTLAKSTEGAMKAGWKTSEFWKSLAAALIVWLQSSQLIPADSKWADVLGQSIALLPVGAYMVSRGALKSASAVALEPARRATSDRGAAVDWLIAGLALAGLGLIFVGWVFRN